MISERSFASSFQDFWQELLPLLTPSRVHVLSARYEEQLHDESGHVLGCVESGDETRDAAIVSEFAYHLAREAFARELLVPEAFEDDSVRSAAEKEALDLISRYEGRNVLSDGALNAAELDEGLQLATRYEAFALSQGGKELCTFQVPIRGCGFLHACAADLVIGDYLVEVKTVKRSLAGKDVRQLVVYLALTSISSSEPWKHCGFFNPRRATFHRLRVHDLMNLISGGKSAVDVYAELIDFTCSSDVQLDTTF